MPHSSDQLETLALRRRPVYSGFYYVRKHQTIVPRAIWNDGGDMAALLATRSVGSPAYSLYRLDEDGQWFRGGGRPDTSAENNRVGGLLNRALSTDDTYASSRNGTIETRVDRETLPRLLLDTSAEWLAFLNVKEWRVAGVVGGASFDINVPAGVLARYTPEWDPPTADWSYAMDKRAAYGFALEWSDSVDGELVAATVFFGCYPAGGGDGPVDVLDELNAAPSAYQLLPRLRVSIIDNTPVGTNAACSSPDSIAGTDAGTEDPDVTFMGRGLYLLQVPGFDYPSGHSLTIEASDWWTNADDWFGA